MIPIVTPQCTWVGSRVGVCVTYQVSTCPPPAAGGERGAWSSGSSGEWDLELRACMHLDDLYLCVCGVI